MTPHLSLVVARVVLLRVIELAPSMTAASAPVDFMVAPVTVMLPVE